MAEDLTVLVTDHGDRVVVEVHGELDLATVSTLRDALSRLLVCSPDAAPGRIDFDLSRLTFCDSSGIAVFIAASDAARIVGVPMAIRNPRPALRRVFATFGADQYLRVADDEVASSG